MLAAACRPRTSVGVLFAAAEVACLRAWVASGAPGPALATAAPGSGLTTTVQLLLAEARVDAVWVGAGTQRTRALLAQAGGSPVSVTMRRKVIVVDEFDAIVATDVTTATDILAFIRSQPPLPVLVLTHATRSAKALEYAKRWPRFGFARPPAAAVAAYLRGVADAHGVQATDADLAALAKAVRGDVRSALGALDLRRVGDGPGGPGGAGGAGEAGGAGGLAAAVKDEAIEGLDLVEAVLRGQRGDTLLDCLRVYGSEPGVVPMGVYENYLASLARNDLRAAACAADAFSAADVVDRHMYAKQAWECTDLYGALAVGGPSLSLRRHRTVPPDARVGVTKFGSVWSKAYNACAKTKIVRALMLRYAEAGAAPLAAPDLAWVRECTRAALAAGDDDELRRVTWPLCAPDVTSLARLACGEPWYKHGAQTRVKRVVRPRG